MSVVYLYILISVIYTIMEKLELHYLTGNGLKIHTRTPGLRGKGVVIVLIHFEVM
jgi:hypothetical protein